MGSWNNSWVKNLPVRPLAPRRKTPGQFQLVEDLILTRGKPGIATQTYKKIKSAS